MAKLAGLPDVIAHGMLTMGLGAGFFSSWSGDPGAALRFAVRLSSPAIVPAKEGADVEFSGKVKSLNETRDVVSSSSARSPRQDLRPRDARGPLPMRYRPLGRTGVHVSQCVGP